MAARKRASADSTREPKLQEDTQRKPTSDESSIAPPKLGVILKLSLFLLVPYFYLVFHHYKIDKELKKPILINAALSLAGYFITIKLIPVASRRSLRRNLFGKDINKKGTPHGDVQVPESLGVVVGTVFMVLAFFFQYFNFTADSNEYFVPLNCAFTFTCFMVPPPHPMVGKRRFGNLQMEWLVEYYAALATICFMLFLGFLDDVFDLPWRSRKLILPSFATLALLMAYAGHTTIVIPKPLIPYVGLEILDLGWIYKLYMFLLAIFCTNSINIHAGINGLEVGQTVVISAAILIHNIMQIGVSKDAEYKQAHAFSIYLVQPLLATSLGLLSYNWYPSSVFVGDTYTYFAGMTLAVVGILGHYSETLLIFFAPQVLNFLLSLPQLSGYIPCPRHRLPRFDPQTGLLTGTNDGTLVNLFLRWFGRMSEKSLCIYLLVFQAIACGFCFLLRYFLAGWYK
ncbi:Glycosyl transferase [Parasponia andersonii]|uniref:UDP-N-acetylglucosamine--dolichyl-phosphate N-acetylglucosaminephosphotransferase n=1 Tax=Parasponia andersonii TaxID=3476 RepID=A0A2P5BGK8_PARAD|nr:Glycosyl transferase [Parasponia andersonii]